MLNTDLNKLAKRLNLTEMQELEPYTLTPYEEERAITFAIEQAQKYMAWKMRKVLDKEEIMQRIALVDWSEKIDRQNVLTLANIAKNQRMWHQAQRDADRRREIDQLKELQQYWTYGRIFKLMAYNSLHKFRKEFDVTPENLPTIKALCFYLARDDRFFTELKDDNGKPFDPLKGLLIRGNSGTGKTHLVQCAEDNGLNPILTLSMLDITDRVEEDGNYTIDMQGKKIIYLDDVGTEEAEVKHFGTMKLWFNNFIQKIYLKTKCYNNLIITTNKNFKGIQDQYGYRVASRMREMFNVVNLTGQDRRNQKQNQ